MFSNLVGFFSRLFKHERGCVSFKFLIQLTYRSAVYGEYSDYFDAAELAAPDHITFAWTVDKRYLRALIEWSGRVNHIIYRSLVKRYRLGTWP